MTANPPIVASIFFVSGKRFNAIALEPQEGGGYVAGGLFHAPGCDETIGHAITVFIPEARVDYIWLRASFEGVAEDDETVEA